MTASTKETIVVAGSLAQKPEHGGHTWVFLNYLLGFKGLGWDVLFLDRIEPEMCVDDAGEACALESSRNLSYLLETMEQFGLSDSFALLYDHGSEVIGMPRTQIRERVKRSAFLLNVMGFLDDPEILEAAPQKVFLDIDPGFGQMWCDLSLHNPFEGHDDFVTIGLNIGAPGCEIPTCGLKWIPTPQPIVLEHWPAQVIDPSRPITTIASWRGDFAPIEYRGKRFGLRAHEFRRFVELPCRTGQSFELALDIHPADHKDAALIEEHGWRRVSPQTVAHTPAAYQRYVQQSSAEFMVAKNMYVETRGAWFSDRSICYLASGKPVLAQDTGLANHLPTGEGLLMFHDLESAAAGVEELRGNYARHARAAREIAETSFESNKVLGDLLARLHVA